ncbi:MAG: soluble lytic murein transglycosylase-like protein [Porticoccus sp.]
MLAVIQIESRFNPYALSYAETPGLMQVIPFLKNETGNPEDNLIDVETNLRYGCTILNSTWTKRRGICPMLWLVTTVATGNSGTQKK